MDNAVHRFAHSKTVGIILEGDRLARAGHTHQLPTVLPSICPGTVAQRIARKYQVPNGVIAVTGQHIAPVSIAVGVFDSIQHCAQSTGGIVVFLLCCDIAGIIVGPGPGLS